MGLFKKRGARALLFPSLPSKTGTFLPSLGVLTAWLDWTAVYSVHIDLYSTYLAIVAIVRELSEEGPVLLSEDEGGLQVVARIPLMQGQAQHLISKPSGKYTLLYNKYNI